MKIALITTTINVPKVLELYRKFAPDHCSFFIAGDEKSPHNDIERFMPKIETRFEDCPGAAFARYYTPARQRTFGYESSELTGWNTDSRRNFALLEALKWGAHLIVSIDDDMIPCNGEWVRPELFEENYSGLQFGVSQHWFDAGMFTHPNAAQRGLPAQPGPIELNANFVTDAKIGVMQGTILGVPDTGAITAIAKYPIILETTDILRNGFVVHPQAYAVFNSQITAFRRELAPAFAQFYAHQGRNTDIFSSMLMRRIMQERNLYTYYGPPTGFHARQPRPLFKDLEAEMFGLKHIQAFADYLADKLIGSNSVVDACRGLMSGCPIFSDDMKKVAAAWYRDCEKVI